HHRLDRHAHPWPQPLAPARRAVVRDLRLLVQVRADAVADELTHYRVAVRLRVVLHRVPDVADALAGVALRDRLQQRLARHAHQPLRFGRDLADADRAGGVAEEAVDD